MATSSIHARSEVAFRWGQALKHLLRVGCVLYLVSIAGLALCWLVVPELHWTLTATNIYAPYFFAPLLIVLPLSVVLGRWLALAGLGVALLGAGLLWPDVVPARVFTVFETEGEPVRVATLNVLFSNQDILGTVDELIAQDVDIIALQELTHENLVVLQRSQIVEHYPYHMLQGDAIPGGVSILSRYPIQTASALNEIRGVRADIDINGRQTTVIALHAVVPIRTMDAPSPLGRRLPRYDASRRDAEFTALLELIETIDRPLVVAGDFNMSSRESFYKRFDRVLDDAFRETSWGFGVTYPNWSQRVLPPQIRIDYIWSGGGLVPLSAEVNCAAQASDHCMVVADLGWVSARY